MGGMIMGLTVTGPSHIDTTTNWTRGRHLELAVGNRSDDPRFFQIALRNLAPAAAHDKPQMSTGLTGPVIVLTQNQPTEIAVKNTLQTATAIHWHGIELESYFDGVPGWNGVGDKRAPAVEPGHTFSARMIPPRAGTFMYHTHWHDEAQLSSGLYGPLLVLEPGERYDPATDHIFIAAHDGPNIRGRQREPLVVNGRNVTVPAPSPGPVPTTVRAGVPNRLRLINITPDNVALTFVLTDGFRPLTWTALAKDGAKLAPAQRTSGEARQLVSVGETYDFEIRPTPGQRLWLELRRGNGEWVAQTLLTAAP
jgi:FtsP/CotA-like multicopper oxidase with cupredoxin domain